MHAMALQSWEQGLPLEYTELPDPSLKPSEVRVAVRFIGVNPVDWKMRERGPLRLAARALSVVQGPRPPVVLGVDFAGEVLEVGRAVQTVKVGDKVVGGTNFSRGQRGSYATQVCVAEDQVCVLPPQIPLELAGGLPVVGATAWLSVVKLGRIRQGVPGQRVLVLGASGCVGQLCVQVAKKVQGAEVVVGVCSGRNAELVRGRGADHVVDYTAGDALTAAAAHGPYHAIIDCAGGYSGPRCRALLHKGGRHVMVAGDSPAALLQPFLAPRTSKAVLATPNRAQLSPILDAMARGLVELPVEKRLDFKEANEAHKLSQTGRMTGKIVLTVQ